MKEISALCYKPFQHLTINEDGNVAPCCMLAPYPFGNIFSESTETIWNSDKLKEFRTGLMEGKLEGVELCKNVLCDIYKNGMNKHNFGDSFISLEINLPASHCNINPPCLMCERMNNHPAPKDITKELCEKIDLSNIKILRVQGLAEIFWKDRIFDVFDYLKYKEYKDNILFSFNSNGICLNEVNIKRFFEYVDKTEAFFSLDASTDETYFKIRRQPSIKPTVENIKKFVDIGKDLGKRVNSIIHFNANNLNIGELPEVIDICIYTHSNINVVLTTPVNKWIAPHCFNDSNKETFFHYSNLAREKAKHNGVDYCCHVV